MIEQQLPPHQAHQEIPCTSSLILAPHPSDELLGCGGLLARHAETGTRTHVIAVTGQAEASGPAALEAAGVLGMAAPEFWNLPQGQLRYGEPLITRIMAALDAHDADLLLAPSLHEPHPDRSAVALAAVEAVRRRGGASRLAFYEISAPLHPNLLVDISRQQARKRQAMAALPGLSPDQPRADQIEALNRYRTCTLPPEVTAAEAFEVLSAAAIAGNHLEVFASEYQRRRRQGQATSGAADLPLVSIIIRSMDRPTLAEALDSIALQTYPHLEVVVVDARGTGHSPLGTHCGDYPLRLVSQGIALHRSRAANAGLEAARGDCLLFLDDDDLLRPDHVAALVEALAGHPDHIAAYSRTIAQDGRGQVLREFATPFDATALYLNNFIPIHAVLFRRQARDAGARFDESLDLCEDWDFWIQVAQHGDFIFVDQASAIYRIIGDGGFALNGDPARARAAEEAVCAKWQARMGIDSFYDIVVRARASAFLQQANEELRQNNELLRQTEGQLQQSNQHLLRSHTELQLAHDALQQRHEQLQQAHEHLEQEHRQFNEHLQHTRAEITAYYENSRSWRLTAPLRRAMRILYLLRRARTGFAQLPPQERLEVLGQLARGRFAAARRQLALAAVQADALAAPPGQPAQRPAQAVPLTHPEPPRFAPLPHPVDVLIPIYNGFEYLQPLFDSLAAADSTPCRLLVCDDASPDERVFPWLEQRLRDFPNARLLRNTENLGFIGTVNRLFAESEHDFVLLNSDVQVPPFWLERLLAPLLADPGIASVTPFTNAGAICSFPQFFLDNPLPAGLDTVATDAVFARLADTAPIELSSAVGFCMAIRRETALRIGMFDPAFGKGYREENDWCERARLAGYRHVLAPNLFVHHKHCGSFSSAEKQALSDRNEVILRQRYPDAFPRYQDFIDRDPLRPLRDFLHLMVAARQAGRPPLVIIDNVIEGGAYAYCQEQIANHLADGTPVLHLLDDFRRGELRAEWLAPDQETRIVLNVASYSDWGRVIAAVQGREVLINNIYSFRQPLAFLDWLATDPLLAPVSIRLALHDFFMLCPSLFLIDADRNYCDLPDDEQCRNCLKRLHIDFPVGTRSIPEWRAAWDKALARMDAMVAFSTSTRDLFARIYPQHADKVSIKPHSMALFRHQPMQLKLDQPLHIGVVGSISWHKGWNILKQLCDEIEARQLPYRITVIGTLVPEFASPCLRTTGRYDRSSLPRLIETSGANVFLFPSIWPETFSYVAHEILACGAPLCCFDLGAPAEAVRHHTAGLTLNPQDSAAGWLAAMEDFRRRLAQQSQQP